MRFEIRAGGALLILLALGGLSAAVFALGLIAGYEMAGQDQSSRPIVSVYPLPKAPTEQAPAMAQAEATPGASAPPAASSPALAGSSAGAAVPAALSKLAVPLPKSAAPPPKPTAPPPVASAPPPAKTAAVEPPRATAPEENAAETLGAERKPAPARLPHARSKPYNIQIGAVMDKPSADDMVRRLRRLGYLPYIVETDIDGRTWYRVRVGPYESEDEARAAEVELRQRYNGAFTTR